MKSVRQRPIRATGWAFQWKKTGGLPSVSVPPSWNFPALLVAVLLFAAALPAPSVSAQRGDPPSAHHPDTGHVHQPAGTASAWEGSVQGIAYSEFNHHVAGAFVVVIALADLRHALGAWLFAWTRLLLPAAMLAAGPLLLIWSDHDAWPIGTMTFAETFSGRDPEILQHKLYGLLLLAVGTAELARRLQWVRHPAWAVPLPLFAIVGGLMLFGHSHGVHPSAQKIAWHHAVMGALAITAGSTKLAAGWLRWEKSAWDLMWTGLILLIGIQLLIYSE